MTIVQAITWTLCGIGAGLSALGAAVFVALLADTYFHLTAFPSLDASQAVSTCRRGSRCFVGAALAVLLFVKLRTPMRRENGVSE